MTTVNPPRQGIPYPLRFHLTIAFVFAGASAFIAAYSRRFGERGGAIITAVPHNALGISPWITGHAWG